MLTFIIKDARLTAAFSKENEFPKGTLDDQPSKTGAR
jgi:hypothetical protein